MRYEIALDAYEISDALDAAATRFEYDALAITLLVDLANRANATFTNLAVTSPNDHNAIVIAFDATDAAVDAYLDAYDADDDVITPA